MSKRGCSALYAYGQPAKDEQEAPHRRRVAERPVLRHGRQVAAAMIDGGVGFMHGQAASERRFSRH